LIGLRIPDKMFLMKLNVVTLFSLLLLLSIFIQPVFAAKPSSTPPPTPKSVCIDAGHGGSDSGATNNELLEKNVNLDVANLLEAKLIENGYTVFMTRRTDITMSNADRYNYCDNQRASILVSVHHNGSTNTATDYTMALYAKRADQKLANLVANTASEQLGTINNGISHFASGVLIKANMPATISEGFFLTNSNEYNLIKNSNRLDQETSALFSAIQSYFSN
jgi:N-acetylmuramoyl-L-alanine amidase